MAPRIDERLRPIITNTLAPVHADVVAGIVGDEPSKYAKTPILWNAVFRELGWNAVSLCWDVAPSSLQDFVAAMRASKEIAGFSVTVPYKVAIVPLLDRLDPVAAGIGAINTVVRETDGALVGFNTDGQGALDALTRRLPGMDHPFVDRLAGLNVLLIGAGGGARGTAFYLASQLGPGGVLRIVNRSASKARDLATAVQSAYGIGEGGGEDELDRWLPDADLVVNATVKGQSGWRRSSDGAFLVEPYSALAAASPAVIKADRPLDHAAAREWFQASAPDVRSNVTAGLDRVAALKPSAACFDLVYSPLETRFLTDARIAGHRTLNGKWMNVGQAADSFARRVLGDHLAAHGLAGDAGYDRVFEIMVRVW
jgi:shikimate dehydrogenase